MKKSLLALAVLATVAGSASAQSTVTLYGQIALAAQRFTGAPVRLDTGNGVSQVGFKGSEDVGGGLKVNFDVAMRFSPESGGTDGSNNGRPVFQGKTIVGVSGGFGAVNIGRQLTPIQLIVANGDPIGRLTSVFAASSDIVAIGYSTDARQADGAGLARTDFIQYLSPNFSGFQANVGYGLKNSAADGNTVRTGGELTAKAFQGATLTYAAGPIYGGLGYEKNRTGDKLMVVNGSYDFGVVKPYLGYGTLDTVATAGTKSKRLQGGVDVPFGAFTAKASLNQLKAEGTGLKTKGFALGGKYDLSKRTWLWTTYGQKKADTGATTVKTKAADVGIFHTF